MINKIYIYNNSESPNIPTKINFIVPDLVLPQNTISEVHNKIQVGSLLFCVLTKLSTPSIIVPSEYDKEILTGLLKFSKNDQIIIDVQSSSLWYTSNAKYNIIISSMVLSLLSLEELNTLLGLYLTSRLQKDKIVKKVEMYIVKNSRNSEELLRTPNYDEAISLCNQNPCCIIVNRADELLYRSSYGKVAVPMKSPSEYKSKIAKYSKDGFPIKFN